MYVERLTFTVKPGCMSEMIKLTLDHRKKTDGRWRIYVPELGPLDQMVIEFDHKDFDEYKKVWAEAEKDPVFLEFRAAFNALLDIGNKSELLELIE